MLVEYQGSYAELFSVAAGGLALMLCQDGLKSTCMEGVYGVMRLCGIGMGVMGGWGMEGWRGGIHCSLNQPRI